MTDINQLVRDRMQLQEALRKIQATAGNNELNDSDKVKKIIAALATVEELI